MTNSNIFNLNHVKQELSKKYNLDFLYKLLAIPKVEVYLFGGVLREKIGNNKYFL